MELPRILVVDLETTCADPARAGIVEIGAVWLTGEREGQTYSAECRPRATAYIEAEALQVNGCTWLDDKTKPYESFAVDEFLAWVRGPGMWDQILMAGMNVGRFDHAILDTVVRLFGLANWPFVHRTLDLHTLAVSYAVGASYPIPPGGLKSSAICQMFGIEPEPKPHRALAGAQWEASLFELLLTSPFGWAPKPCARTLP